MISRVRSSPRCSTSVASSPCWRRRGSTLIALRRRRRWLVRGAGRQLGLLVLVRAGDRILELAHALAERAPDLRQALGPEHEQGDDQDHDQPGDANLRQHGPSVALSIRGQQPPHPGPLRYPVWRRERAWTSQGSRARLDALDKASFPAHEGLILLAS